MLQVQNQPYDQFFKAAQGQSALQGAETSASKAPSEIDLNEARAWKLLQPENERGMLVGIQKDASGKKTSQEHAWLIDPTTGKEIAYVGPTMPPGSGSGSGAKTTASDGDRFVTREFLTAATENLSEALGGNMFKARQTINSLKDFNGNIPLNSIWGYLTPAQQTEAAKAMKEYYGQPKEVAANNYARRIKERYGDLTKEQQNQLNEALKIAKKDTGPGFWDTVDKFVSGLFSEDKGTPTITNPKEIQAKPDGFRFKGHDGQLYEVDSKAPNGWKLIEEEKK